MIFLHTRWAVDKSRNMERRGTFRNIEEHQNCDNYKEKYVKLNFEK